MKYQKPQMTYDELAAALMETNRELEAMERSRTEFYANISHDLRSPLAALSSSVEYLQSLEEVSKEELKNMLKIMQGRLKALTSMVNDMFLLTTLENEEIPFTFAEVSLVPVIEEFFFEREMDKRYEKRKLTLAVSDALQAKVSVDIGNFLRVLDNLFTNALKYSDDGDSIELGASLSEKTVNVWVRDTGIGISEVHVPHIFDRAYTVSKARTPDVEKTGCGLGLSIVKTIVKRMHGNITCTSKEGEGSVFTISLPLA